MYTNKNTMSYIILNPQENPACYCMYICIYSPREKLAQSMRAPLLEGPKIETK